MCLGYWSLLWKFELKSLRVLLTFDFWLWTWSWTWIVTIQFFPTQIKYVNKLIIVSIVNSAYLSNLATWPLCSRTSQTHATCSCVNPNDVMVELLAGAGGGAVRLVSPTLTPELPRLEKLEKLERHWPTLENAEKKHSWILKFKSLKASDIVCNCFQFFKIFKIH